MATGELMTINRVREIRELRRLTQAQVADKLHTTSQTVGRYEREDQRVDLTILSKLSKVLKCTIAQLAGEVPFELGEEQAEYAAPINWPRMAAVIDALDHHLAENKLKIHAGGRSDIVRAIYDWSIDQNLKVDEIGDLSGIRSLLRPVVTQQK